MWRYRADAMMRKSIRMTKASLPNTFLATCPTDLRWNRAVNRYPQRARSSRHPHEARGTSIRGEKVTASADRTGFPPLLPLSRVTPAARLLTVAFDRGFASGLPQL